MMVMACYGMLWLLSWHAGLGCKVPGGDGSERGAGGAKHCRFHVPNGCFKHVPNMVRMVFFNLSSFRKPTV